MQTGIIVMTIHVLLLSNCLIYYQIAELEDLGVSSVFLSVINANELLTVESDKGQGRDFLKKENFTKNFFLRKLVNNLLPSCL